MPPFEGRRAQALRARDRYRAIHARTGGYYPAVNAATLSLVAGEPEAARELARAALDAARGSEEGSYYAAATAAEAHLLLGDEPAALLALERAADVHGDDYGSLATTRRQLRLVCALTGSDPEILRILAGPGVAHFCGHRIAAPGEAGRFPAEAEQEVAERHRGRADAQHAALRLRLAGQRRGHPVGRGPARARSRAARRPPVRPRRVHRELGRLVRAGLGRALPPLPERRLQRHLRDGERVPARRRPLPLRQRAGDGPRPAARALPGRGRPPARRLGRRGGSRRGRHGARHRHLARHGLGVS